MTTHGNPQILTHCTAPPATKNQPINHSPMAFSLTATNNQPNTHGSFGNNTTPTTTIPTQSKPKIKPSQNPQSNPFKTHNQNPRLFHSTRSTLLKTHSSPTALDWHQNPRVCSKSAPIGFAVTILHDSSTTLISSTQNPQLLHSTRSA